MTLTKTKQQVAHEKPKTPLQESARTVAADGPAKPHASVTAMTTPSTQCLQSPGHEAGACNTLRGIYGNSWISVKRELHGVLSCLIFIPFSTAPGQPQKSLASQLEWPDSHRREESKFVTHPEAQLRVVSPFAWSEVSPESSSLGACLSMF